MATRVHAVAVALTVALLLLVCGAQARNFRMLLAPSPTQAPHTYTAALVNATSGLVSIKSPVAFPPGCTWDFANGPRGRSTTEFYMNMTWYMLATQTCNGKVNQTALLAIRGPDRGDAAADALDEEVFPVSKWAQQLSDPASPTQIFVASGALDRVFTGASVSQYHLAWDWTCNIVVVAPSIAASGDKAFHTLQISEYDGQVRPQKNSHEEAKECTNCWVQADGAFSAMDYGDESSVWTKEWYCGDKCALVTVWQHLGADGKVDQESLVGTSFRTSEKLYSAPNTLDIQTLTFYQPVKMFFGVGICCDTTTQDCPSKCMGHAGQMVLVAWGGAQGGVPRVIQTLGAAGGPSAVDKNTIRLGVEQGTAFSGQPASIFIALGNTIQEFAINLDKKGNFVSIKLIATSSQIESGILDRALSWATTFY